MLAPTLQVTRSTTGPQCCPTGLGAPIERESAEELAVLLKAVADATRLQIIALLRASADCSACVCDIAEHVGVSQPTVSHHLRILASAGIVEAEKRGYWTWYSLQRTRLAELSAVLT
jgi:ArsR family transcriptional regulator